MKPRREREWSNEAFDEWMAASDRDEAIAAAADEEGGPRLSLVTVPDRAAPWPTDLLPAPAPAANPRTSMTAPSTNTPVIAAARVDRRVGLPVSVVMPAPSDAAVAWRAPRACITDDRP